MRIDHFPKKEAVQIKNAKVTSPTKLLELDSLSLNESTDFNSPVEFEVPK